MSYWQKARIWLAVGAFVNGLAGLWFIAWLGSVVGDDDGKAGGLEFAALVTGVIWIIVHAIVAVWASNAQEEELIKWFGDDRREL